ncbi:MAG: response regulator transcription factor [Bdellovibrionales bacterium]|nr:response regulator transcription factor [Bdellovibrionales bacterium]
MSRTVLVVDDEKLARDRIVRFITEIGYDFEVNEAASGIEALEKIQQVNPDVLFLDIQIPGLSGIEVLQQIETRTFKVIFQTAYDEYAIQAFEKNACDYLLKPFTKDRLKEAIDKAIREIETIQRLSQLEEQFRKRDGHLTRLAAKQGVKTRIIELDDVYCFVSRDHYTCVHIENSEFITDLSLSHLEERLNPERFVRCHRNNIVSLAKVESVVSGDNMTIQLANGLKLPVSRQNRQRFKKQIINNVSGSKIPGSSGL